MIKLRSIVDNAVIRQISTILIYRYTEHVLENHSHLLVFLHSFPLICKKQFLLHWFALDFTYLNGWKMNKLKKDDSFKNKFICKTTVYIQAVFSFSSNVPSPLQLATYPDFFASSDRPALPRPLPVSSNRSLCDPVYFLVSVRPSTLPVADCF